MKKAMYATMLLPFLSVFCAATDYPAVFNMNMPEEASNPLAGYDADRANDTGPRNGAWVDMKLLQMDEATIARYVLLAREAGLTHLYPAVFRYGCNFYSAPKSPFDCGNQDLLAKFITVVNRTAPEISVTPWFERAIEIGSLTPQSLSANTSALEPANAQVNNCRIMNLDNKDVREHFLASILTLRAYGVNSVQIDDNMSYDVSPAHHNNSAFKANPVLWKAKLTRFVNWLSASVHAQAPDFRIEIAQHPQNFALTTYLADWKHWNVNEVVVECYRSSGEASATDQTCGNGRRGVAFLVNNKALSDQDILDAAKILKDRGIILFHLACLKPGLAKELGGILK